MNEDMIEKLLQGDEIRVEVSEDEMEAYIFVPASKMKNLTEGGIKAILKKEKIASGIDEDAIERIVSQKLCDEKVLIAKGKPATTGENGRFEFLFNSEIKKNPKMLPDGSVDYKNTKYFQMVKEGDKIAEYVSATRGESGYTVKGRFLTAKPGKEVPPLKGQGFYMSEDKREYFAKVDGKIEIKNRLLMIEKVLIIKGDVDLISGNVDFVGDVHVKGDVASGMVIKAKGQVVVSGHVGAAIIEAGEDIILKSGISGNDKAVLSAGGDIHGKFFESATIRTLGNLYANSILNSEIEVAGVIQTNGKHGTIIGGKVHATGGITVGTIGSIAEIPTQVECGINEGWVRDEQRLQGIKKKTRVELGMVLKALDAFQHLDECGNHAIQEDPRKKKLLKAKSIKEVELEALDSKIEELQNKIKSASHAKITVTNKVFRGAKIILHEHTMYTTKEYVNVSFIIKDGQVDTIVN